MNNATAAQSIKTHIFEQAGLGKAPFRILGCEEKRGPIRMTDASGLTWEVGAPGQPMGSCKLCGQGIAICWSIKSADGKTFVVGSDCVEKTGDAGLRRVIAAHEREMNAQKRAKRAEKVKTELAGLLTRRAVRHALRAMPHPMDFEGQTALDNVRWMLRNCGAAGRARLLKELRSIPEVANASGR